MIKKMVESMTRVLWLILLGWLLVGCSPAPEQPKVRLAINPWPGYEFLYLASEKGFFKQYGLDIEIVEMSSLADVQRLYIQGRVDAFGSTVIEAVQAAGATQSPLDIVLIPDFSNGGDVIIGNDKVASLADLKGKKVGAEVGSLGMFILHAALRKEGMSLADVNVVNVEQLDIKRKFEQGLIDAVVTYPPYSLEVLKLPGYRQVFDTTAIPEKVIDTISLRHGLIGDTQSWVNKFHQVWQHTLEYAKANSAHAYEIMAERQGITVAEFGDALSGLELVGSDRQQALLGSEQLKQNIVDACMVLKSADNVTFSCDNITELVRGHKSQ